MQQRSPAGCNPGTRWVGGFLWVPNSGHFGTHRESGPIGLHLCRGDLGGAVLAHVWGRHSTGGEVGSEDSSGLLGKAACCRQTRSA